MKIGMIGLGKMGANLARNLKANGFEVVVFNRTYEKTREMTLEGFVGAKSLSELVDLLGEEAVYWMMVPAGQAVEQTLIDLMKQARPGSVIIDGGNSRFHDTIRRANMASSEAFDFLDVGTSGGQEGALRGACMMIGGDFEVYTRLKPVFEAVCVPGGAAYMGPSGAGHYVKMVHNGIEYGMMQAIAEGFELLNASTYAFDLKKIAHVWQHGSIIESYLVGKTHQALEKNPVLEGLLDRVDSSGEGLWTVQEALERKVPLYTITASLFKRYESQQEDRFSNRLLAAIRNEFGGHAVHKKET